MHVDLVALLAIDRKEIVDTGLTLAEVDGQGADRGVVERRHDIGTDAFGFERDAVDRLFQGQRDHGFQGRCGTHATCSGCFSRVISVG